MTNILIFYVRVILNRCDYEILAPLHDLNISVGDFMSQLILRLKKEENEKIVNQFQKSINHSNIFCLEKPCRLNSKFIDLLSKVEKIDGKDADVFEFTILYPDE